MARRHHRRHNNNDRHQRGNHRGNNNGRAPGMLSHDFCKAAQDMIRKKQVKRVFPKEKSPYDPTIHVYDVKAGGRQAYVVYDSLTRQVDPVGLCTHADKRGWEKHGVIASFTAIARAQIPRRAEYLGEAAWNNPGRAPGIWRVFADTAAIPVVYDSVKREPITCLTEQEVERHFRRHPDKRA